MHEGMETKTRTLQWSLVHPGDRRAQVMGMFGRVGRAIANEEDIFIYVKISVVPLIDTPYCRRCWKQIDVVLGLGNLLRQTWLSHVAKAPGSK
jgi:hypothetical protein